MEQNKDDTLVSLEVVRAEHLRPQKFRKYYIKCTVGEESKTVRCVIKGSTANFQEPLRFLTDHASQLDLRVFLRNIIRRDELVGGLVKDVSELVRSIEPAEPTASGQSGVKEIVMSLTNLDSDDEKVVNSTVTLRLVQMGLDSDPSCVAAVIQAASDNWQQKVDASVSIVKREDQVNGTIAVSSKAMPFVKLLQNIKPVVDAVDRIAELHPYARAAWTLISAVSNVFMSQIDRDTRMTDLADTMSDMYKFVREGEALQKVAEFREHFNEMFKQTIECAYFIQAYAKNNFAQRALSAVFSDIDKTIDSYNESFEQMKTAFRDSASLYTTIAVCRVLQRVDDLDVAINLNDITYAEGMRFRPESSCLPGTRTNIIEEIIGWANDADEESSSMVFLLTGLAGSGKSSIAHSVASHFDGLRRLGSSFFCSRAKPEGSAPEKILCTVARDIADLELHVKQKLAQFVNSNRSLCKSASVREQYNFFIKRPIEGLSITGPIVIVIDALDECEGDERLRKELMKILASEMPRLPRNFRIFLTARNGDPIITNAFKAAKGVRQFSMQEIGLESTSTDISTFIGSELESIEEDLAGYDSKWQGTLTEMSGGAFIWASTACRFIIGGVGSGGVDPCDQLKYLLSIEASAEPFEAINTLYKTVLERCFQTRSKDVMERFRAVMKTILLAYVPLSSDAIGELLGKHVKSRLIISPLGALLTGSSDPKEPVELLHTSFRDYLTNQRLSGEFHVDSEGHHAHMAKYCLDVMNSQLRFNVCDLEDIYALYESMDLVDLEDRKKKNISDALRYSCQHWGTHILQMSPDDFGVIEEALLEFLVKGRHMMQWIEVISVMMVIDGTSKTMRALSKWFKTNISTGHDAWIFINDCLSFLESFSLQITRGPLQVYLSALPFTPVRTPLYQSYRGVSGYETRPLLNPIEEWMPLRSYMRSEKSIQSIAFSPDGTRIASLSVDAEVQLWDFSTLVALGKPQKLMGQLDTRYRRDAFSLVVSPGNEKIAVSTPEWIEVWDIAIRVDAIKEQNLRTPRSTIEKVSIVFLSDDCLAACWVTGQSIFELWIVNASDKQTDVHNCDASLDILYTTFSPDGAHLGILGRSGDVNVYSLQEFPNTSPHTRLALGSYNGPVNFLALSCDASFIVVASLNGTVNLWSKAAESIIWTSHCQYGVGGIVMPLTCDQFMTTGRAGYLWKMDSGEHYVHMESSFPIPDDTSTLSPDGQYYISVFDTVIRVYALDGIEDQQQMFGLKGNSAIHDDRFLYMDESLNHMRFSPDGTIIAVSIVHDGFFTRNGRDIVLVRDGVGTPNMTKQSLHDHPSFVKAAKVSLDGMKIASWDETDDIWIWTRGAIGDKFQLKIKHKVAGSYAASRLFVSPDSEWESYDASVAGENRELTNAEMKLLSENYDVQSTEDSFFDDSGGQREDPDWLIRSDGKKLLVIHGRYKGQKTQRGATVILYNHVAAALFEYKEMSNGG